MGQPNVDWVSGTHADGPTGGFGGVPYGATKRCIGFVKMPNWVSGTHADGPIGDFGGASHGATKRCTGWVKRMEEGRVGGGGGRKQGGKTRG
eukprot:9467196-Pyramimonas_sp.AAC.1